MAREANFLCDCIESNQEKLRRGGVGSKVTIDKAIFRVVQTDRNVVYRIKKDFKWYLKMPHGGGAEPIYHEIAGAKRITNSLAKDKGYLHPSVIRGSTDFSYVLYSEIVGQTLNIAFYSHCLLPFLGRSNKLKTGFNNFGQALGGLHRTNSSPIDPAATPNLVNEVQRALNLVGQYDSTLDLIASYLNKHNIQSAPPTTFIHGNLKLENVLFGSNKVAFIDFENCGYGSPYEDLSWPTSQMILTRSLFGFPWKLVSETISGFLESYKSFLTYEREQLLQYITLRVSLYYIQVILGKFGKPTIAGLPIRLSTLQKMTSELISGNYEKTLPGINL